MRITKQICNAIESLLRDKDYSETQLADKLGVAQRTVNSWKRGEVGSIKDCYWEQLEPMLRPYLNESPPTTTKVVSNAWRVYANTMMMEAGVDENLRRRALGHADSKDVHYGYSAGRLEAIKAALERIP